MSVSPLLLPPHTGFRVLAVASDLGSPLSKMRGTCGEEMGAFISLKLAKAVNHNSCFSDK